MAFHLPDDPGPGLEGAAAEYKSMFPSNRVQCFLEHTCNSRHIARSYVNSKEVSAFVPRSGIEVQVWRTASTQVAQTSEHAEGVRACRQGTPAKIPGSLVVLEPPRHGHTAPANKWSCGPGWWRRGFAAQLGP